MSSSGKAFQKLNEIILGRIVKKVKNTNNSCNIKHGRQNIQINITERILIMKFGNVLKRAVTVQYYNLSRFARVLLDRPLVNYKLIDKFMKIHRNEDLDLMTNIFPISKGLTTENFDQILIRSY